MARLSRARPRSGPRVRDGRRPRPVLRGLAALLFGRLLLACASATADAPPPASGPAGAVEPGELASAVEAAFAGERVVDVAAGPERRRALVFVGGPEAEPSLGRVAAERVELFDRPSGARRVLAAVAPGTPGPWANAGWSPDGRYLAILESRWGPIQIYAADALEAPAHRVDASGAGPDRVHRLEGWVAPSTLLVSATCCGTTARYRVDARSGAVRPRSAAP